MLCLNIRIYVGILHWQYKLMKQNCNFTVLGGATHVKLTYGFRCLQEEQYTVCSSWLEEQYLFINVYVYAFKERRWSRLLNKISLCLLWLLYNMYDVNVLICLLLFSVIMTYKESRRHRLTDIVFFSYIHHSGDQILTFSSHGSSQGNTFMFHSESFFYDFFPRQKINMFEGWIGLSCGRI